VVRTSRSLLNVVAWVRFTNLGASECKFFNTKQFHAGGEQPGMKQSWVGHSEWRPVSFNLSLVRGYVCPEMEKGWLLG